ncbi:MAG: hypothetical protein ACOCXX_03175 [Planctomycetota bacterium]
MTERITANDYLSVLEPWAAWSRTYDYVPPERTDLLAFGSGYNTWGVQTHQKAFSALAVLAADPATDYSRVGCGRDELIDRCLRMLRFNLESHIEGSFHCTDGTSWGHTWISVLGVERMMHAVEAIESSLADDDRELLERVLVSEADWLTDHYEIVAGPIENNKPESNLWNGALLHRVATMYPDTPRAEQYRDKGSRFLVNSISIASDADSDSVVDGRPVHDWFIGDQFFDPSFALNHHRYLNVGYMVICLSNAAMVDFFYRTRGVEPPEALLHHLEDLWNVVRGFVLPDGRLCRIGGDTRVRYCYCQDYLIPTLLQAAERFGSVEAPAMEAGWLAQVRREVEHNGDGSYLSDRCRELSTASQLYYTRLESDRACTLSMGAYWRRVLSIPDEIVQPEPLRCTWHDDYHGASMVRGRRRLSSWVWRSAERPQGLVVPVDASDMAEWQVNLSADVVGEGGKNIQEMVDHGEAVFDGGFVAWGRSEAHSSWMMAEGQREESVAYNRVAFAALPDDRTTVVLQHMTGTPRRVFFNEIRAVNLKVPNDLFNGNTRRFASDDGTIERRGVGSEPEELTLHSDWLTIDDRLSLVAGYGIHGLQLLRPGRRQIGLSKYDAKERAGGMLFAEEIVACRRTGLQSMEPGSLLVDCGFAVLAGTDAETTRRWCNEGGIRPVQCDDNAVRAVVVKGDDGSSYVLALNTSEEAVETTLEVKASSLTDLSDGTTVKVSSGAASIELDAGAARLFRVK